MHEALDLLPVYYMQSNPKHKVLHLLYHEQNCTTAQLRLLTVLHTVVFNLQKIYTL